MGAFSLQVAMRERDVNQRLGEEKTRVKAETSSPGRLIGCCENMPIVRSPRRRLGSVKVDGASDESEGKQPWQGSRKGVVVEVRCRWGEEEEVMVQTYLSRD